MKESWVGDEEEDENEKKNMQGLPELFIKRVKESGPTE